MGFELNSCINAIISTVAKYHAVSPEGLLEAWNEMEQHKDICYAKTADDIINALGWLADLYAVYGYVQNVITNTVVLRIILKEALTKLIIQEVAIRF